MINIRIIPIYSKIIALKNFIKGDSSSQKYFGMRMTNARGRIVSVSSGAISNQSRNHYSRSPSRSDNVTSGVLLKERLIHRILQNEKKLVFCKRSNRLYSNAEEKNLIVKDKKTDGNEWGGPEADKLIIKLEGNYLESIKTYESLLVYFYTSWCKHCQKLKSVYGASAVKMKEDNVPGRLAVIDLTERMDIADKFNIVSVPIIYYFKKGKFMKVYDGKRTMEDIVNFMKNPPEKSSAVTKIDI